MERTPVPADERIAYGPDPSQFFDVYAPRAESTKLAIYIHGGFWRSKTGLDHASHLCHKLAQEGFLCASMEYRRAGATGGGWPTTFQDVGAAFSAIRQKFASHGRPVVLGHSAGGHLALLLAANTRELRGVVALGAVSCLEMAYRQQLGNGAVEEFMGGTPEEVCEFYAAADPVRHRSYIRRMLVHGTADDIVPLSFSRHFLSAREKDCGSVSLVEIPEGDHFDVIDPLSFAWPTVVSCAESTYG